MTRGYRSVVVIGGVKQKSAAWGFDLVTIETREKIPVDFAIDAQGCISLIRSRRLKYPHYRIAEIQRECTPEIREPKTLPVPEEISARSGFTQTYGSLPVKEGGDSHEPGPAPGFREGNCRTGCTTPGHGPHDRAGTGYPVRPYYHKPGNICCGNNTESTAALRAVAGPCSGIRRPGLPGPTAAMRGTGLAGDLVVQPERAMAILPHR